MFGIRDSSENTFLDDFVPDACPINGQYHWFVFSVWNKGSNSDRIHITIDFSL